jgi:hypothetical protein
LNAVTGKANQLCPFFYTSRPDVDGGHPPVLSPASKLCLSECQKTLALFNDIKDNADSI